MSFYLYILFSKKLDRYYIGVSTDIDLRLKKHLQSKKGFTSRAKDWEIVYSENYVFKTEALAREKQLKNWKSRVKLEELMRESNK